MEEFTNRIYMLHSHCKEERYYSHFFQCLYFRVRNKNTKPKTIHFQVSYPCH